MYLKLEQYYINNETSDQSALTEMKGLQSSWNLFIVISLERNEGNISPVKFP
jgi:hypothetical protein